MADESVHIHRFSGGQTAWHVVLPVVAGWQHVVAGWQHVSETFPEDGAWCWVWHTQWSREDGPQLVQYRAPRYDEGYARSEQWWTDEGHLSTDQLTHWMPAQVPTPPPEEP